MVSSQLKCGMKPTQNDDTISRDVHFAETPLDLIYSGPHIGVANPLEKHQDICQLNSTMTASTNYH